MSIPVFGKVLVLTIFSLSMELGAQGQDHGEDLKQAIRARHAGLQQETIEARRKAFSNMLPRKEDVEFLFPEAAAVLWPRMEQHFTRMLEHIDEIAKETTTTTIENIKVIDLHKENAGLHEAVLAMIKDEIPAYRVVVQTERGSSGSSTYLLVKGRWIQFQGLEAIPEMLRQLGEKP